MSTEELRIADKVISLEKKENLPSKFKIKSYKMKLKSMEERKILQKNIDEVIQHFFIENTSIPQITKESIFKIIYFPKERVIMLVTDQGKEIIWKRQELVNSYGWFFFVIQSEEELLAPDNKQRKSKEQKPQKQEKTISVMEYPFEEKKIPLKQKINMRSLYSTKEYFQYLSLMRKKNVAQMSIHDVLDDFFKKNQAIPLKEKKAIGKIIYYAEERVIVIKSLIGDKMYEELKNLVNKYGWYFYITGVPVGQSDISIAIDNIEKRYDISFIESKFLLSPSNPNQQIDVSLFPISLKPNHNCHILRLGNFNILLDCGIFEEDFKNIDEFFSIISKQEAIISPDEIQEESKNLEEIDKSLHFEKLDGSDEELNQDDIVKEKEYFPLKEFLTKPTIDAIFISHSHFDHLNGLKRLIEIFPDVPILCSRITLDLYLLRDSDFLKQDTHDTIENELYRKIIRNVIYVENGTKIKFQNNKCYLSFYHAGHMPGALMIMAKIKNFRFLYTGDYTYWDYTPFAGTRKFLEQISRPIDYLLIDSTSAYEKFDNMNDQINSLMLFLEQKAEYGDNCLIGADPSSLAITFMLTIWRYFRKKQLRRNYQKRPNIYVDMMVRKNIQVINHRYEYIYGPISKLIRDKANPFNSIKFRWFDYSDMEFLKKKNNIIISHPPDLSYGIIRNAVNIVARNPHNMIYLAGAIHEEPGVSLVYPSENEEKQETEITRENTDTESKIEDQGDKLVSEESDTISEIKTDIPKQDNDIIENEEDFENEDTSEGVEDGSTEINKQFEPYVIRKPDSKNPLIYFNEEWKVPFRAMLLNHFAPNLRIKLHGDKIQLFETIKILEPKQVCFFHQNPRKLVDLAQEVKELGVQSVSISQERHFIKLN